MVACDRNGVALRLSRPHGMSLKVHASWSAGAAIVLAGSRFALGAVLARRLDAEVFGTFVYAQWLVEFSFLLLTLGANGAVSRYAAEYRRSPARLTAFMRAWRPYARILPFGAAVASVVGAKLTGLNLSNGALLALAGWTLASGLLAMQTAALTGLQRFDLNFFANALAASTMLLGAALLPFEGSDPRPAFIVMAVACAIALLPGFKAIGVTLRGEGDDVSKSDRQVLMRYALNIWFTGILWSLAWSRGELPVVRALLGDEGVAHYAVAMTLLGGAMAGVMLGISGLAPQVTRHIGEGRRDLALQLCRKAGDFQLLVCGMASMVLIWLGPELILIAFGDQYVGSSRTLGILSLCLPSMALALNNHFLQITTDSRFNRNATLIGLVALYVLALWLVPALGGEGAAWARTFALWVMAAATIAATLRVHGADGVGLMNFVRLIPFLVAALVAVVAFAPLELPWRLLGLAVSVLGLIVAVRTAVGNSPLASVWRGLRI